MISERMLELIILDSIFKDMVKNDYYAENIKSIYDVNEMQLRYNELGKEFLNRYKLDAKH